MAFRSRQSASFLLAVLLSLIAGVSSFHHHGALPIPISQTAQAVAGPNDEGPERCAVCAASHAGAALEDRSALPDRGEAVMPRGPESYAPPAWVLSRYPGSPRSPPSGRPVV